MTEQQIVEGDCLQVLPTLQECCVDAVVTDPPYGLLFMGRQWDRGVPGKVFWDEVFRVCKPGAHLVAFGGTRTFHRLTCAIEDAGFEIRDCLSWLYSTGFPKGRGALKPAWEPITLARKPLVEKTVAENTRLHGTGGLSTDVCRNEKGRWPANVVLDEEAAAVLDEQSGESVSRKGKPRRSQRPGQGYGMVHTGAEYNDCGGASRFFYCAKASRKERGENNHHPTVKPLALMRWLVRLVTPVSGLVLDPFAGSGTTLLAAQAEDRSCLGIDIEKASCETTRERLADAQGSIR